MAAQTGSEVESSETTKIRKPDIIDVPKGATTATTAYKAVGETGAEIITLCVLTSNGALGTKYVQGVSASETEFTYNPDTKTITLPTDIAKDGDIKLVAFYDYEADGAKVVNKSDVFGKTLKVYVDCIGTDVCDREYKCQFVIPRGQFSGEFSVSMGGDQTVQEFTINTLVDTCAGSSSELFEFIVYQD